MRKGCLFVLIAAAVALIVLFRFVEKDIRAARTREREEYTRKTVSSVKLLAQYSDRIASSTDAIPVIERGDGRWITPNLIVMTNREWIAYAARCVETDWRVGNMFVGRGSDGAWYCSTNRFGKDMQVLRDAGPSGSLAEFVLDYGMREFEPE